MIINPDSSSHWYAPTENGFSPCYEVNKKNGGGTRRPTLADARKHGWLPSVTAICSVLPKPALVAWKQNLLIEAALSLPKTPDELVDEYARRVADDAETISEKAREFGTRIHNQIEAELICPGAWCHPDIDPFLKGVRLWIKEYVKRPIAVEAIVGSVTEGFAGKVDLYCEMNDGSEAIIDYKTSSTLGYYPEFSLQLSAYGHCLYQPQAVLGWPRLITVLIPSKEPGPCDFRVWDQPDYYWDLFKKAKDIWCYVNNYSPNGKL